MSRYGITPEQAKEIRRRKGLTETKLQKIRFGKGISQSQLSELSGVAKRAIQSYEQQTRFIDGAGLETICDLCLSLGCKIEDILESEELIEKFKAVK